MSDWAHLPKHYARDGFSYLSLPFECKHVPFAANALQMKAWLNARPTIVVTGSSQYNRENLAAALLKHTFRFELLNNPQPYGAYFGDAYTEALDMRGREGTAALHELAEFKVLALLEVQNLEDQDKRNLRALLWKRRHSQITIMTSGTPHLTKVFDEDVRQLISQDLRLIEL